MDLMSKVNRAIEKQGGWSYSLLNGGDIKRASVCFSVSHNGSRFSGEVVIEVVVDHLADVQPKTEKSIRFIGSDGQYQSFYDLQEEVGFCLPGLKGFEDAVEWTRFSEEELCESVRRRKDFFGKMRQNFCLD